MLFAILAIWFGYKKAKDTGRNPILWGAICGATFIGAQLLTGIVFGIFIGFGIALWGWPETLYDDLSWLITIAAIIVSLGLVWVIFRFLDRVPEDDTAFPPPPPPTFGEGQS
jgi:cytochrome c biogenesis protein CcdA